MLLVWILEGFEGAAMVREREREKEMIYRGFCLVSKKKREQGGTQKHIYRNGGCLVLNSD